MRHFTKVSIALLAAGFATSALAAEINLRVMETTDIHVNLLSYEGIFGTTTAAVDVDPTGNAPPRGSGR